MARLRGAKNARKTRFRTRLVKMLHDKKMKRDFKILKEDNLELWYEIVGDFALKDNTNRNEISLPDLPTQYNLYDIGEQSIKNFIEILNDAKTVFLSGPCGVFEKPEFMKGTKEIFTFVANQDVFSIVGGGHTVAAVEQLGLDQKMSHISTGGGSLEKFMMGEKLPAVEALKKAKSIQHS